MSTIRGIKLKKKLKAKPNQGQAAFIRFQVIYPNKPKFRSEKTRKLAKKNKTKRWF